MQVAPTVDVFVVSNAWCGSHGPHRIANISIIVNSYKTKDKLGVTSQTLPHTHRRADGKSSLSIDRLLL